MLCLLRQQLRQLIISLAISCQINLLFLIIHFQLSLQMFLLLPCLKGFLSNLIQPRINFMFVFDAEPSFNSNTFCSAVLGCSCSIPKNFYICCFIFFIKKYFFPTFDLSNIISPPRISFITIFSPLLITLL